MPWPLIIWQGSRHWQLRRQHLCLRQPAASPRLMYRIRTRRWALCRFQPGKRALSRRWWQASILQWACQRPQNIPRKWSSLWISLHVKISAPTWQPNAVCSPDLTMWKATQEDWRHIMTSIQRTVPSWTSLILTESTCQAACGTISAWQEPPSFQASPMPWPYL